MGAGKSKFLPREGELPTAPWPPSVSLAFLFLPRIRASVFSSVPCQLQSFPHFLPSFRPEFTSDCPAPDHFPLSWCRRLRSGAPSSRRSTPMMPRWHSTWRWRWGPGISCDCRWRKGFSRAPAEGCALQVPNNVWGKFVTVHATDQKLLVQQCHKLLGKHNIIVSNFRGNPDTPLSYKKCGPHPACSPPVLVPSLRLPPPPSRPGPDRLPPPNLRCGSTPAPPAARRRSTQRTASSPPWTPASRKHPPSLPTYWMTRLASPGASWAANSSR